MIANPSIAFQPTEYAKKQCPGIEKFLSVDNTANSPFQKMPISTAQKERNELALLRLTYAKQCRGHQDIWSFSESDFLIFKKASH